jgi:tetrapyrrole methylase family protein/MazG family protein
VSSTDLLRHLERLLSLLDPSAQPADGLQIIPAESAIEPNPFLPTLVHGFDAHASWNQAWAILSRTFGVEQQVTLLAEGKPPEHRALSSLADAPPDADALYIPAAPPESALRSLHGLRQLVHRLRAPGGCPWDREQTHESLVKFIIEEAYEVADAIRHEGRAQLAEELGDLLFQVFIQAELAEEAGEFSLNDVVAGLSEKLIRRHPHVFGDVQVDGAADVERNWERLKAAEKDDRKSALDGIPRSLPSLMRAQEMQRKMKKAGFDWPDRIGVENKLIEELAELRSAPTPEAAADEFGDVLFILARLALDLGVSSEDALRGTNRRVDRRFRYVEARLQERGVAFGDVPLDEALALWAEAKVHERAGG